MSDLPEGWDSYDPNDHDRSDQPSYQAARAAAARRAKRRRAAYGEALSALRRARSLTQVAVAEQLGVAQGEVSRIEHQGDLLLSTLARYIDAMDGSLSLLVRFADSETIELRLMLDSLTEQNPDPSLTEQDPDPSLTEQDPDPSLVPDPMTAIHLAG